MSEISREIAAFPHRRPIPTRWTDNDAFGHMNNTVHYQLFDTAVNLLLRDLGTMQAQSDASRFLVVESGCRYLAEMFYPDTIIVGLRIAHLGRSSVRYEFGLFRNDEETAAAVGFLVHVNTTQGRPLAFGPALRSGLERLRA